MKKIVILDSDKSSLYGLNMFLDGIPEFNVVHASPTLDNLNIDSEDFKPDIIILDVNILKANLSCFIENINNSDIIIICYTNNLSPERIKEGFMSGIDGYISKNCFGDDLISAIKRISKKNKFVDTPVLNIIIENLFFNKENNKIAKEKSLNILSNRESEIYSYILEGNNPKEIAELLYISHKTVLNQRSRIFKKLKNIYNDELIENH